MQEELNWVRSHPNSGSSLKQGLSILYQPGLGFFVKFSFLGKTRAGQPFSDARLSRLQC
jgi:hypothetical protein